MYRRKVRRRAPAQIKARRVSSRTAHRTAVTTETAEFRANIADQVNRIAYTGERVILRRRGKPVAALVPVKDLRLLEAMEDRIDLEAARKALEDPSSIPWEKVKAELGL
jgi:prevent-host-death family protein